MERKTVKIPSGIGARIDQIVSDERNGYSTRTEFVNEAVRAAVRRVEAARASPRQAA